MAVVLTGSREKSIKPMLGCKPTTGHISMHMRHPFLDAVDDAGLIALDRLEVPEASRLQHGDKRNSELRGF